MKGINYLGRHIMIKKLMVFLAPVLFFSVCAFTQDIAYMDNVNVGKTESNLAKADKRITIDFKDIDIIEALKYLSEKAKFNIIPTSGVQGRVTLMVDKAPIDDVAALFCVRGEYVKMLVQHREIRCFAIGSLINGHD